MKKYDPSKTMLSGSMWFSAYGMPEGNQDMDYSRLGPFEDESIIKLIAQHLK